MRRDEQLTLDQEIAGLKREILALTRTLGTLIAWLPGSATAPIRLDEADALLKMLDHGAKP